MLARADRSDALAIAKPLCAEIQAAVIEDGGAGPFNVTASFGIADARDCDYDLLQLLKTADQRLYAAKRAGGNRVVAG